MRIISNFNDYYDGAQAYGQDPDIVYQRKTIEYKKIENAPERIKELHNLIYTNPSKTGGWIRHLMREASLPRIIRGKPDTFSVSGGGVVIFCGKAFRFIRLVRDEVGVISSTSSSYCFYTADSMIEFCEKNKLDIDNDADRWARLTTRDIIRQKFDKKYDIDVDWLIGNKVICATVYGDSVTINPPLKPLQFFKVMDSYKAYGELDMWICGTLAYPQNEMVTLDDKSLIAKHGFDKWSFRKQPEGYKG